MFTYTGCSGFHYKHWKGAFYPDEPSKNKWLPFYAKHFKTVEINNSFYKLSDIEGVRNCHTQTSDTNPGLQTRFSNSGKSQDELLHYFGT